MSSKDGNSGSKGADSAPNIQPGKGVDPKAVQVGIERRSVPEPPAPAPPRGGWFGGGKK